jgi:hypothetical protein
VNYPSQVRQEADGRIQVSFINVGTAQVPYIVKASLNDPADRFGDVAGPRRAQATPPTLGTNRAGGCPRARQDREIVYFLQQPETHAFDLYHDYKIAGVDLLNVVRGGSASNCRRSSSTLAKATVKRSWRKDHRAMIDIGEAVTPQSEVVSACPAVKPGQSVRLRFGETRDATGGTAMNSSGIVPSAGRPTRWSCRGGTSQLLHPGDCIFQPRWCAWISSTRATTTWKC